MTGSGKSTHSSSASSFFADLRPLPCAAAFLGGAAVESESAAVVDAGLDTATGAAAGGGAGLPEGAAVSTAAESDVPGEGARTAVGADDVVESGDVAPLDWGVDAAVAVVAVGCTGAAGVAVGEGIACSAVGWPEGPGTCASTIEPANSENVITQKIRGRRLLLASSRSVVFSMRLSLRTNR